MGFNTQTMPRTAGLVVARGGSNSIPRKNLQMTGGVPMIAHTFMAAGESGMLDRVILSSDDKDIIGLAAEYGVEAPFKRPAELAGDKTHVIETTFHAINWLAEHEGYEPEYFMLLQPTSPLRNSKDIRQAISLALRNDADAVVSLTPARDHPCLTKTVDKHGKMKPFIPSDRTESRRQELPETYSLNGAIYMVKRKVLLSGGSWCPPGAYAYIMPRERSIDVDSLFDLKLVNLLLNEANAYMDTDIPRIRRGNSAAIPLRQGG